MQISCCIRWQLVACSSFVQKRNSNHYRVFFRYTPFFSCLFLFDSFLWPFSNCLKKIDCTHKTCYLQTSIQISSTFYQCLRTIGQKGKFYTIILTRLKSILDGRFENFRRKNFRHSCRSHHTFRQRVTDSVRLQYSLIGNPKLGGFPRTSPIVREDSMLALALAFARHCVGHAVPGQARLF